MPPDFVYLLVGGSLLLAVLVPAALQRQAVSAPMVLLLVGALAGLLPLPGEIATALPDHRGVIERLAEFTVIVALMGVGLALDRPLDLRRPATWRRWNATWRLIGLALPLTIAAVAGLGWWLLGLGAASAVLLGSVLSPTDPVLASDVQVSGPTSLDDEPEDEIDEKDEVRFALTSEAGLNDGLAFPFVTAGILLATSGGVAEWGVRWLAWDVVGKVVLGVAVGVAVGWLLARLAFRAPRPSLRLADTGEPLLALAAVLLAYGTAETVHAYGFLSVFVAAMTMRASDRGHDYHVRMHETIERLERLLTLVVLLLLGFSLSNGLLDALTWQGSVVAVALVVVIRPAAAYLSLAVGAGPPRVGGAVLARRERLATAFFGVRGVGSVFYLAFALGHVDLGPEADALWAIVGFTITLSVLVHGVTAVPAMRWLDRVRETAAT